MASAPGTPQRRSMADLNLQLSEIFDALPSANGTRSASLQDLPRLIASFEARRGIELLNDAEKDQLSVFAAGNPEQPVGVDDLLQILQFMGANTPQTPRVAPPSPPTSTPSLPPPALPSKMLTPDLSYHSNGSPAPRARPRTTSSLSTSSVSSVSSITSTTPTSSPSKLARAPSSASSSKRRSFLSALSFSPGSSPAPGGEEDLSGVVSAAGVTYLGVQLDGTLGAGWDAEKEADQLRVATKGLGTREKEVVAVLADKTFPQIRSVDKTYKMKHGKSLLELVTSEKSLRGNMEYALKGLLMGPLNWDVELLHKAMDGVTKNDTLLIDLLISRPPSSLALLRLAYSHRLSTSGSPAKHKSLDAAVLAAYSGNSKMRKALEVALEGKWVDVGDGGEGSGGGGRTFEEKVQLLKEDVDQLRVAMPRGASGNQEIVSRILLARSPTHIHSLAIEYLKTSRNSLTHAIKESFTGSVEKMFLYAVENGKQDRDGPGVWRDAKMLEKTMEGAGTRNEALTWRLIRLHWDRPRFLAVQNCFKQKYKKSLVDRIHGETSGAFRDLLKIVITSATLPEPLPSPEDVDRLDSLGSRSRGSSISSAAGSAHSEVDEVEGADVSDILEGTGELSNPPSPRSPPPLIEKDDERGGESTPLGFSSPRAVSRPVLASRDDDPPSTPTLSTSSSTTSELGSSTSSVDGRPPSGMGHRSSSSLSFRQRSSPLETYGHNAPSSAGGSALRTFEKPPVSSLRHNRPPAPGRIRRTSEELVRAGSEEPTSLSGGRSGRSSPVMAGSPTPSSDAAMHQYANVRRLSGNQMSPPLPRSFSSGSSVLRGPDESQHGRPAPIDIPTSPPPDLEGGSPPASLDPTSYHAAPISPVGDVGPSSSPPTSPSVNAYSFSDLPPLGTNLAGYFDGTDKSSSPGPSFLRREKSTASNLSNESRPGSLFYGEGVGVEGTFRPESIVGNFGLYGRPGSTASMGGSGDQFQMLLRHAHELAKMLKEAEARLATSASSYEEDHTELEGRLEEVRAELQIKRREEKELRGAEKQHLNLIASLEGDVAKITKQLERSRESYDGMKRSYQDQCTEAEKLRSLVAETRRDLRAAEEAAMTHTLQVQGFEKDRAVVQLAINKLEDDLAVARQAQDSLEEQKQANLLLKETIDRLKFELDEVRSVNRKSLFDVGGSSGGQSHAGSEIGSISKSLGKELARRLAEAGVTDEVELSEEEETEGEEEEVDDIIVTTHRRIKKRGTKSTEPSQPTITRVEETTVVVDAHTQTDTVSMTEMHVQTDLSATTIDLVPPVELPVVQVVEEPTPKTGREIQEELAKELGIDWTKLSEFVEGQKAPPSVPKPFADPSFAGVMSARRAGRWATRLSSRIPNAAAQAPSFLINVFPNSARPYVSQILDSSTSFVLYSIVVYLSGVISGSVLLPLNHHHHLAPFSVLVGQSDVALWNQYNTIGRAWGEGLATSGGGGGGIRDSFIYWVNELVWGGVSIVRRVPT